jgi:hypothetical protein
MKAGSSQDLLHDVRDLCELRRTKPPETATLQISAAFYAFSVRGSRSDWYTGAGSEHEPPVGPA